MLFIYRNWLFRILGLIIYIMLVAICMWVMSAQVKKFISVRKTDGPKEAFKQASYHFIPVFVLFVLSSVIFIYGSIVEIGGYYKVDGNTIKMRYVIKLCGENVDLKASDIDQIVILLKKPKKDMYSYNKIKESLEKHKTYSEIESQLKNTKEDKKVREQLEKKDSYATLGIGAYDTVYLKIKNKYYIPLTTRFTNSEGKNLYEYIEKKYNVPLKVIGTR